MDLRNILSDVIGTGELLTVVYHGGHAPGTKRRLLPLTLDSEHLYAREDGAGKPKAFFIHKLELVPDDFPVAWARDVGPGKIMRLKKVDPKEYFLGWAYVIPSAAWPALGVVKREYVDRAKTNPLREAALRAGVPKNRILDVRATYFAYGHASPPSLDFHVGDIFYSTDNGQAIQVIGFTRGGKLEAHHLHLGITTHRYGHHLAAIDLANWLRCGAPPTGTAISPDQSISEILRFMLSNSPPNPAHQMPLDL